IDQARRTVDTVSEATQQVVGSTDRTAGVVNQMARASLEVVTAVEQVATTSARNASSAEQVSAATAGQSGSVREVGQTAQQLTELATALRTEMRRFTLDEETRRDSLAGLGPYVRLRGTLSAANDAAEVPITAAPSDRMERRSGLKPAPGTIVRRRRAEDWGLDQAVPTRRHDGPATPF